MRKTKDFRNGLYEPMKKHNIKMENTNDMINNVMKSISKLIFHFDYLKFIKKS